MRTFFALLATSLMVPALGCGDGTPVNAAAETLETTSDTTVTPGFEPRRPSVRYEDPRQAVKDFLIAVKSGNDATATALLTTAAQKEAWANGLAISGDGFPDADFDVSEVEYVRPDVEAHVMSTWSDKTPAGEQKTFECVWLLHQEQHGWCIYGMATKFLEGLQPIVLNFENQTEMQKKQQWAEEQIIKHRQLHQQNNVAAKPGQETPR